MNQPTDLLGHAVGAAIGAQLGAAASAIFAMLALAVMAILVARQVVHGFFRIYDPALARVKRAVWAWIDRRARLTG
jgi:hypothetical protein